MKDRPQDVDPDPRPAEIIRRVEAEKEREQGLAGPRGPGRPRAVPMALRELEGGASDRMRLERTLARGAAVMLQDQGPGDEFAWILGHADNQALRGHSRITTLAGLARLARAKGESVALDAARIICRRRYTAKHADAWLRDLRLGRAPCVAPRGLAAAVDEAIDAYDSQHPDLDAADVAWALQTRLAAMTGADGLARLLLCQWQAFASSFPDVSSEALFAALDVVRLHVQDL